MLLAVVIGGSMMWSPIDTCCRMRPSARAASDIIQLTSALKEYALDNDGRYPPALEVLVEPDANGDRCTASEHLPTDPWGRSYIYEPPHIGESEPRVATLGRDGELGGEDDDADIDWRNLIAPNKSD